VRHVCVNFLKRNVRSVGSSEAPDDSSGHATARRHVFPRNDFSEILMFKYATLVVALGATITSTATTAQDIHHSPHHPAPSASAAPLRHDIGTPGGVTVMVRMNAQMEAMKAMHKKIAAARTASEREALMPEHMKLMQEGMSMLRGMSPSRSDASSGASDTQQQIAEKRLDMMELMMQMLVDGMPAPPQTLGKQANRWALSQ
jgi:hypothetical protein